MALILLLSALVLGVALVRRVGFALYPFEFVAAAVVVGLFGWTWLVFLFALISPYEVALPLTVTAAAAASVALWYPDRASAWRLRPLEGGRRAWALWGGATVASLVVLGRLYWTHSLVQDDAGIWSAGATWADFGLHSSIATHIAHADRLPLDLPVADGEQLTYPFLIDLLTGLLIHGGMGLHASFFIPGVLLALAICQLLISFSLRLFHRMGAAVLALVLVLTTGSAAGLSAAYHDWKDSGKSLPDFLGALPKDYTGLPNAQVTNLLADAMLPQRAILFGLGVGLVALIAMHVHRETGDRAPLFLASGVVGLLPMGHPHTFVVAMLTMVALGVEAFLRTRALPADHLRAVGLALVLAAPQLAWQQTANDHGTGGRFRFGWMKQPGESLPAFLWHNFGLAGVFFLALPFLLWCFGRREYLVWFAPAVAILFITHVYAFQPFEYDNLKMIYWAYVFGGLFAGWLCVEAFRVARWTAAVVAPVLLAVSVPGALAITREFQLHDQFASTDDMAVATWARQSTGVEDVFLASDRPNIPVATLGGRSVVMGYRGWLFNFSVPYGERAAAVSASFKGRLDDSAVRRYAPDYLLVGTWEDDSWQVDRTALAAIPAVYENPTWKVYRLPTADGPPLPTPTPPPSPSPSAPGSPSVVASVVPSAGPAETSSRVPVSPSASAGSAAPSSSVSPSATPTPTGSPGRVMGPIPITSSADPSASQESDQSSR